MTLYLLEPIDTQFHRSTLPFDAGADGDTATQPLPWPRTVYGAMRALGFSQAGISLAMGSSSISHPVWGTQDELGDFFIKGPFLFSKSRRRNKILLPAPADLAAAKDKKDNLLRHCVPNEACSIASCSDCSCLPGACMIQVIGKKAKETVKSLDNERFLPSGGMLSGYLLQNLGNMDKEKLSPERKDVFAPEPRVGIMRSARTHTVQEGQLYSATHYRMRDRLNKQKREFGYWLKIETRNGAELSLPERGVFHLGGERRPVRYCRVKADDALQEDWASASRDEVIQMIACHGRFKLFLITPGIFEGKVHPFEETGEEIFINIKEPEMRARLVGMTMNRQIPIGGWDIQKSYPKPLQRAVSDGAVYFFCIENWPESTSDRERLASKVFDALNFRSLCSGNFEKEGFGIVLIGGWHV